MTPALLRYKQIKEENPNTVLLYRMGDFYESFYEDAVTISKVLDIALTSRDKGTDGKPKTPMAGIPYHALDPYLVKLVDAGYKVAIAEQEEEKIKDEKSGKVKTVIHRNVSKIVTPSTYDREADYSSHYLVSISVNSIKSFINQEYHIGNKEKLEISLACIDPNGSTFWFTTFDNINDLDNELFRLNPSEILISEELFQNILVCRYISKNTQIVSPTKKNFFTNSESLLDHLKVKSLKSFGVETEYETQAVSACFNYLSDTQHSVLIHITKIEKKTYNNKMYLDSNAIKNLEIVQSSSSTGTSLLQILDYTRTRGGKRLLKERITTPLSDKSLLQKRIDALKVLYNQDLTHNTSLLDQIYDLERVCARISYKTASPRDLLSLANSIHASEDLNFETSVNDLSSSILLELRNTLHKSSESLKPFENIIRETLNDPAPANTKDGHFIKENVSKELDELRQITQDSKKWLKNLEIMEQQKTGISSLRVKYNRVFGYFLEVSKGQVSKVPENYIRKQTTVNGERYITTELKEKESMILGANDRIVEIEQELYEKLLVDCQKYISDILNLQIALSELDLYISLVTAAQMNNYCEPVFTNNNEFHAIDARHPVIEKIVKDIYVYNDIHIENGEMILITGPNMGGKSTFIRMTALIAYMSHIGSFVPAKSCHIGIIDSIFTRVGASDDLSRGESTFMVEMTEAANILRNATEKSLIILDEIGRGTSTYDGMSIAWAIVYYIHEKLKSKTLFATHYHELTVLEDELKRMKNYTVGISENDGNVVFLRKIEKGKAEKSFGIHVAKLAGLPEDVLNKASEILHELEHKSLKNEDHQFALWEFAPIEKPKKKHTSSVIPDSDPGSVQKNNEYDKLIQEIKDMDVNNMTPMDALIKLNELRKKI